MLHILVSSTSKIDLILFLNHSEANSKVTVLDMLAIFGRNDWLANILNCNIVFFSS